MGNALQADGVLIPCLASVLGGLGWTIILWAGGIAIGLAACAWLIGRHLGREHDLAAARAGANVLAGRLIGQWRRGRIRLAPGESVTGNEDGRRWTLRLRGAPEAALSCLDVEVQPDRHGAQVVLAVYAAPATVRAPTDMAAAGRDELPRRIDALLAATG